VTRPPRRSVLRGALAAGVVAGTLPLAGGLAACARTPEGPDELEAPLAAARADAARAAAGAGAFPELAARLGPVADARRAHADALAQEIRRARPDRTAVVDAPVAAPPAPAAAGEALGAVRDGLGTSRDAGRSLALTAPRYRAGLLASVAGSCGGLVETLA